MAHISGIGGRFRFALLVACALAASLAAASTATAQSQRDIDLCWGPNPDEGIPACTRLIAVYTGVNLARTYGTRGHLLNLKGDLEGALRDFNEAIRIDPSAGDGWYNRGVIYRKKGLRDLAIADFRRALRINPNDTDAIKNLEALGERP